MSDDDEMMRPMVSPGWTPEELADLAEPEPDKADAYPGRYGHGDAPIEAEPPPLTVDEATAAIRPDLQPVVSQPIDPPALSPEAQAKVDEFAAALDAETARLRTTSYTERAAAVHEFGRRANPLDKPSEAPRGATVDVPAPVLGPEPAPEPPEPPETLTPGEHTFVQALDDIEAAERLLTKVTADPTQNWTRDQYLAVAQIHATLACARLEVAAATQIPRKP